MSELPINHEVDQEFKIVDLPDQNNDFLPFTIDSTLLMQPILFQKRERIDSEEICVSNLNSRRWNSAIGNLEFSKAISVKFGDSNVTTPNDDTFDNNFVDFAVD